jgi:signal recognition particle receptor subunit beta
VSELKIIFTGPMGAGKTTAIHAVSDSPPISTDVSNSDSQSCAKESTTVAMDLGQMSLDDGTVVRLYGTPGQPRFAFMWEILVRGAMGIILLINASSARALEDLRLFASTFHSIAPGVPLVIGIGHTCPSEEDPLARFEQALRSAGIGAPLFSVDVRQREDTQLLIEAVVSILEASMSEMERGVA